MPKRTEVGVVISDKMQKTRRVEIPRQIRHPKYGKIIRRRTVCYVHDESSEAKVGDKVEIIEARPRSKTKRWELVRVVEKRGDIDVAAMKAARDTAERDAAELAAGTLKQ
jgi:small subunit ribosomal protein S17